MIIPRTKLDFVMWTFNNYHLRLRFTCEIETNGTLNFLNTTVIREGDGSLVTNWFRKPTFSGRYINFYSNHPHQYKLNTIKNLVDHAILLSDIRFHFDNLKIVKSILLNNGYPRNIVNNETKKRYRFLKKNRMKGGSKKGDVDHDKGMYTMAVLYIGNVSDDIRRIVKNMVDVSYTIPRKLDTVIRKGKDKLDDRQTTEIVYRINCRDCNKVYIGQTKRHLATRIKEHRNNINNPSGNFSVVTEHRLRLNHDFDWEKPNILHREKNRKKREIAEMFYIKKFNNNINLQKDTENLNSMYDRIILE